MSHCVMIYQTIEHKVIIILGVKEYIFIDQIGFKPRVLFMIQID